MITLTPLDAQKPRNDSAVPTEKPSVSTMHACAPLKYSRSDPLKSTTLASEATGTCMEETTEPF